MEIKGWHRRFLGNTSSAIWHVDRRMGKDFITILDLVKYQKPVVVLPDDSFRAFQGRTYLLYSTIKNLQIELVPETELTELVFSKTHRIADALYFLEYSQYSLQSRRLILDSAKDIDSPYSLLKMRAQNLFPIQIISSYYEDELKILSQLLEMPINRVPKDY